MTQTVENPLNTGDMGSIPGLGGSLAEGDGYPFQYFLPGEPQGQKRLVGYHPWGYKQSNTAEQLTLFIFSVNTLRQDLVVI